MCLPMLAPVPKSADLLLAQRPGGTFSDHEPFSHRETLWMRVAKTALLIRLTAGFDLDLDLPYVTSPA